MAAAYLGTQTKAQQQQQNTNSGSENRVADLQLELLLHHLEAGDAELNGIPHFNQVSLQRRDDGAHHAPRSTVN
jgi:hypothetical protein